MDVLPVVAVAWTDGNEVEQLDSENRPTKPIESVSDRPRHAYPVWYTPPTLPTRKQATEVHNGELLPTTQL